MSKTLMQKIAFYLLVAVIVIFALFPFYYAVISSLKTGSQLFEVTYWPQSWNLDNYLSIFRDQPFGRNIFNSILVSTTVVFFSLLLGVTAAYALGQDPIPRAWPVAVHHSVGFHVSAGGCPVRHVRNGRFLRPL